MGDRLGANLRRDVKRGKRRGERGKVGEEKGQFKLAVCCARGKIEEDSVARQLQCWR
jgi:hypothetical protein